MASTPKPVREKEKKLNLQQIKETQTYSRFKQPGVRKATEKATKKKLEKLGKHSKRQIKMISRMK